MIAETDEVHINDAAQLSFVHDYIPGGYIVKKAPWHNSGKVAPVFLQLLRHPVNMPDIHYSASFNPLPTPFKQSVQDINPRRMERVALVSVNETETSSQRQ
jgi:hypothetical protein